MEYAAMTDVGMKRYNNEDSYIVNTERDEKIFIVADGMGGHNAGEIASRDACRKVESHLLKSEGELKKMLSEGVQNANRDLFIHASERMELSGMGTTIDACVLKGDRLYVAHVGDSRVYVISHSDIRKITKDHSVVGMMLDSGSITEEEAKNHPQRHFITRAVGTSMTVDVDIIEETIHNGEWVLMCTDGLTNMVSKNDLHSIVIGAKNVKDAATELVNRAKENGGDDNITVILFHVAESEE